MPSTQANTSLFKPAFGMSMLGNRSSIDIANEYKYGFNGKENIDEVHNSSGTFQDYGFRMYDTRLCRFISEDPITKYYPELTPYQFASNTPIQAIDLDGLEAVFVFDQQNNPNNRRVYTAEIYVITDDNIIHGPYKGSSYPNFKNTSNTLKVGIYNYNNKYGHKLGTKKGLNIIDNKGRRIVVGISPTGKDVQMTGVNVHSGQDPKENNGKENRGSKGCITISPKDADAFFDNFDFSGNNGITGKAEGFIAVYRATYSVARSDNNDIPIKPVSIKPIDLIPSSNDKINMAPRIVIMPISIPFGGGRQVPTY